MRKMCQRPCKIGYDWNPLSGGSSPLSSFGQNVDVAEYVRTGLLDAETCAARSEPKDLFELVRKENMDELMEVFPVKRLHYAAADGCALLLSCDKP